MKAIHHIDGNPYNNSPENLRVVAAPSMAMKLRPWAPPNFASLERPVGKRQDGIHPSVSFSLADLDQTALDGLVTEWIRSVYEKAGKPNPWFQS